jgi:hypothetical protein
MTHLNPYVEAISPHPDAGKAAGERGTGVAGAEPRGRGVRLFETVVLIVGVGRQQDRVTIRRKAEGQ